jgi:hypothetical protein
MPQEAKAASILETLVSAIQTNMVGHKLLMLIEFNLSASSPLIIKTGRLLFRVLMLRRSSAQHV